MRRLFVLFLLLLTESYSHSQVNIADSVSKVLTDKLSDTIKIDKINAFLTRYASSDPSVALLFSDSMIMMSLKIKDSSRYAHSYSRKGIAQYYLGDYNGSLESYFKALNIKENIGQHESAWREYNNIGLVLRNLDQSEEALNYYKLALDLVMKTGDKSQLANIYNNIGICHNGLKQYDAAQQSVEKALQINTEIGADQALAQNLNNLGTINSGKGNYLKAIEFFEKALKINKSLYNIYEQVQNMNNLAEIHLKIKNYTRAKQYLVEVNEIFKNYKADQLKLNHLMIYGDFYVKTKDYKNAVIYKNHYISVRDSIFDSNRFRQFDQLKILANAEKEIQRIGFLEQINTMQTEKLRIQRIILIVGSLLIIIILILLIITVKNLRIKKALNYSLIERTHEIETLNEELKSTNEELHTQRDNLEDTLSTLQNTQQQLVQAEKMASLGVLASGIAHEINNPLNYISGGLMGLKDYLKNPQENEENINFCLNAIDEGIDKASTIVSGLNFFSRNKEIISENIDLHRIIDTCLMMLNSEIVHRIEIKKRYIDSEYFLSGNEGKLHQVFMNIFLNSIHAIKENGEISIITKIMSDNLVISITDNGCGIAEDKLTKVFDPFFTTKDPGQGTGLGLSITYNIIKEHNGRIEIDSKPNMGTNVKISLPINNRRK